MSAVPDREPTGVEPLRVAVVIERYSPDAGGNERSTSEIVQRLAERGHQVTVVCSDGEPSAVPEGVELLSHGRGKPRSSLQLWAFRRWAIERLAAGGYEVSMSVTMAVPATVLQPRGGSVRETIERNIAMRKPGFAQARKRLAVRLNPKQQTLLALEKQTLADPAVQAVAAVSRYVARQFKQHYGLTDDQTVVIPNGAACPAMTGEQKAAARRDLRKALHIPDHATLFLFAAQNPRLKGFGPLIGALKRLRQQGQEAVVLLAGQYRYTHHAWIAEVGVREQVRMIGPTRDMPTLYAAADVTVLPTFYDPASKVVLESLMLGTPAISTGYNGASDFIAPEGGPLRGRVVADPADEAGLAAAMAELCAPEARAGCVAAMGGVAEQVSMQTHVDALERLLDRVALRA
jgi:UDP-glucose:(heptosyl)LPS alpha-1,3-glucosyltransferase